MQAMSALIAFESLAGSTTATIDVSHGSVRQFQKATARGHYSNARVQKMYVVVEGEWSVIVHCVEVQPDHP
jgi:hypothetical protein